MLLILRKLKHSHLNSAEFRKYLLYALGEMALVVIGILIALQIDNWNTDKLEQEALKGYLSTIYRNMAALDELRSERTRAYELGVRWNHFPPRNRPYDIREVMLASHVMDEASTLRHFHASSSGYEALKSSGILDEMQGTDIEKLLFDYYDTVARIARSEHVQQGVDQLAVVLVTVHFDAAVRAREERDEDERERRQEGLHE